jgi:hypothetical protein
MRAITRIVVTVMLVSAAMVSAPLQPASAAYHHSDLKLIGSWVKTLNSTDSSGNPCPFVPDTMEFFPDNTMTMTDFGSRRLPYKTALTRVERHVVEERKPELKGKDLLVILPNPGYNWFFSPMTYAYSVEKNELTITVHGWTPAKFTRVSR